MKPATKASFVLLAAGLVLAAAETYQKPPKAVLDAMNALPTPNLSLSPSRNFALQGQGVRNPPIAELSQPMLRLAGQRINPKTNGLHNTVFNSSLTLRKIPEGTEIKVDLPPNGKFSGGRWSQDGTHFAFTNTTAAGVELWVGDTTGKTHRIEGVRVNEVMGGGFAAGGGRGGAGGGGGPVQWLPDGKGLLVYTIKANRGPAPRESSVPEGPHVQQSLGGAAPVVTHEDMLQTPHDEDLWEYYATSQLAAVDLATGKVTPVGKAGIIESAHVSPDGRNLLVTAIHRPFSYLHQYRAFPKEVEVWDRAGKLLHKVASQPLEDRVPISGVATGPRSIQWRPSDPSTVMWVEALDGGDLKNSVPYRDRLMALKAPFTGDPVEVYKIAWRFSGIQYAAKGGLALIEDSDRKTRHVRTTQIDLDKGAASVIWDRNNQDRYRDPGSPVLKASPNGQMALLQDGDNIYLSGLGASAKGDHPFLDRFNLTTKKSERLFQCDDDHYETFVALLDDHAAKILTRRESPTEPPNYYLRAGVQTTAVTKFPDPQPIFRKVTKQLVTYKRPDGVPLSFELYLPPDYKPGTRLPTVMWAYPREFNDADTAGQVSGSSKRFTEVTGYSEIFHALDGFAVLANAAMPVVGSDPDTVNNSYIDQIVADAKAAIDKATEMGVTDPNRVGVGGHSYGAFMTANLLAHCDLFKAGVAESGAHNRTLTPFGFQSERRTLWQASDIYLKMSPFMYADKIKTPILLIHGEADDNDGTFPIQSDRMYQAIRGNGGIVRLVFLPFEAHGYRAKETVEHVVYEKFTWFNKYVKNASSSTSNDN
jgi:dipeptidyl aminopeptidase/acylaminoacyl peptidase